MLPVLGVCLVCGSFWAWLSSECLGPACVRTRLEAYHCSMAQLSVLVVHHQHVAPRCGPPPEVDPVSVAATCCCSLAPDAAASLITVCVLLQLECVPSRQPSRLGGAPLCLPPGTPLWTSWYRWGSGACSRTAPGSCGSGRRLPRSSSMLRSSSEDSFVCCQKLQRLLLSLQTTL